MALLEIYKSKVRFELRRGRRGSLRNQEETARRGEMMSGLDWTGLDWTGWCPKPKVDLGFLLKR